MVRLDLDTPAPRLDWFPITRYNKYAGELLAAFELLLVSKMHRLSQLYVSVHCVHSVRMKETNCRSLHPLPHPLIPTT